MYGVQQSKHKLSEKQNKFKKKKNTQSKKVFGPKNPDADKFHFSRRIKYQNDGLKNTRPCVKR